MNHADYTEIKSKIIDRRVVEICNAHQGIRPNRQSYAKIHDEYDKLEHIYNKSMSSNRLDSHKMCTCLCLAILKSQPYDIVPDGTKSLPFLHIANECLALQAALDLLDYYAQITLSKKCGLHSANSVIKFPNTVTDKRTNFSNLVGLLYRLRRKDEKINLELLSQMFYYLEVYNIEMAILKHIPLGKRA